MNAKSLLIPVAAFAVTATSVSAFNPDVLTKAGLSDQQISAFEEAHDLRHDGDRERAREVLVEAGIDMDTMENIREAMHEAKKAHREAMHEALETDDYEAFLEAIADSPLADIITSEADYELFKEAHELREAGEIDEAKAIMGELGFEPSEHMGKHGMRGHGKKHGHHREEAE